MPEQPIQLCTPKLLTARTGGYRYIRHMAAALEANGHPVHVDLMPGDFLDVDVRAINSLGKRLKKARGRIVLDAMASAAFAGLDAKRMPSPAPVLLSHHVFADDPDLGSLHHSRLAQAERVALERCGGVIATSHATVARLRELGAREEHLHVVRAGTPSLGSNSTRPRHERPPRVLCIAPVVPSRGHDLLVEALGGLGERDWQCQCIGSLRNARRWVKRVQARAGELGIAERIEWSGDPGEDDREFAWQQADILVVASRYDGCAMVVDEALARGVPVVATRAGALAEPMTEDTGWIVPPADSATLAIALGEAIDDPQRRESCAAAGREVAANRPGWDRQAVAFATALSDLVGH